MAQSLLRIKKAGVGKGLTGMVCSLCRGFSPSVSATTILENTTQSKIISPILVQCVGLAFSLCPRTSSKRSTTSVLQSSIIKGTKDKLEFQPKSQMYADIQTSDVPKPEVLK